MAVNNDYIRGFIEGLAIKPLAVVGTVSTPGDEPDYCGIELHMGIGSDDGHCAWISYE